MSLVHTKNFIGRLFVGFQYQINLLMTNFKFDIKGKSTTVPQKGNLFQEPFHTMPTASVRFTTYVKTTGEETDEDLIAIFLQFGREQAEATLLIADRKLDKVILQGDGIFNSISLGGRAGDYVMINVSMTLSEYRHSKDALVRLMI